MGRDLSGQNLQGRNFRGQDLRGASFVNADIRGTNFTDAELQGADFTRAIAGLQKRWVAIQISVASALSFFLGILVAFSLFAIHVIFQQENVEKYTIFPGVMLIVIFSIFVFSAITQGPMAEAFRVGAGYITGISVGVIIHSIKRKKTRVFVSCFLILLNIVGSISFLFLVRSSVEITILILMVIIFFNIIVAFICFSSVKRAKKLAVNLKIAVDFSTIGGTVFSGANLSNVNFTGAKLANTIFVDTSNRKTNIRRTCFNKVEGLEISRDDSTILRDPIVRQLLVSGKLMVKMFSGCDLRGANLNFYQLEGIDLRDANISQASFVQANLKKANLSNADLSRASFARANLTSANFSKAQAVGTNFSGAVL